MSDFNPGPGWRLVPQVDVRRVDADEDYVYVQIGGVEQYFVREEPVPLLPTEPYTVIRVIWKDEDRSLLVLHSDGVWDGPEFFEPSALLDAITGFEVLAEPRAVTAKGVLDRIAELHRSGSGSETLRMVAAEFGVSDAG